MVTVPTCDPCHLTISSQTLQKASSVAENLVSPRHERHQRAKHPLGEATNLLFTV